MAIDLQTYNAMTEAERIEACRRMTMGEKFDLAHEMGRPERERIAKVVREEHPDWPEACIPLEVARRLAEPKDQAIYLEARKRVFGF